MSEFQRFALATAVYNVAWTMMEPAIPLFIVTLGGSKALVGVVVALASVLPLFLAVHMGLVTDRLGPRRVMLMGGAGASLAYVLFALAPDLNSLVAAQIVLGAGHLLMTVAGQNWVARQASGIDLYKQYGAYAVAVHIGQVLGPTMAGWVLDHGQRWLPVAHSGFRMVFLLALLFAGTAGILFAGLADGGRDQVKERPRQSLRSVAAIATEPRMQRALLLSLLLWFALSLKRTYFPLYLEDAGISHTGIGLLLATYSMANVLIRPFLGWLVQKVGQARLLFFGFMFFAPAIGLIPFATNFWLLGLLVLVWGTAHGIGGTISLALVPDLAPPDQRGSAIGLRIAVNRFSEGVVPLVYSAAVGLVGLAAAFVIASAMLTSGMALATSLQRLLTRNPPARHGYGREVR